MLTATQILSIGAAVALFFVGLAVMVDIFENDGRAIVNIFKAIRGK